MTGPQWYQKIEEGATMIIREFTPLPSVRPKFGYPSIEVCVGKHRPKIFPVPKNLVIPRSGFFSKTVTHEWYNKIIELPDHQPDIFDLYLQLLYTGKVPRIEDPLVEREDPDDDGGGDDEKIELEKHLNKATHIVQEFEASLFAQLHELYALCEKMEDEEAKDLVMREMAALRSVELIEMGRELSRWYLDAQDHQNPAPQNLVSQFLYQQFPGSQIPGPQIPDPQIPGPQIAFRVRSDRSSSPFGRI
ncbi:hypothetical protein CC78DRAFT_590821 [Lojkania enalia]|uniref:BTB domain-containing protein n=1 Tax=Lojkania enalia TaxID=147567 RepID=A0A9P4K0X8_9PLEO|nr:hypothetical protein CC78DRAFT_590821 [Didymosphaeria enalia]